MILPDILFRAKQKSDNTWVYGIPIQNPKGNLQIRNYFDAFSVIPETLSQYTGIKDEERNPLYDGDIIKVTDAYDNETIYLIDYKPGGFCAIQKDCNFSTYLGELYRGEYSIKKLGNIFDDSELF